MNNQIKISEADKRIVLPLSYISKEMAESEMEIFDRFMRHLRHVPNNRMEIKILSSIQFTADLTNNSDAHVAKVLVDMGLLAPRMAFPADFLRFFDQSLVRSTWSVGAPSKAMLGLLKYWESLDEDRFSVHGDAYNIVGATVFQSVS